MKLIFAKIVYWAIIVLMSLIGLGIIALFIKMLIDLVPPEVWILGLIVAGFGAMIFGLSFAWSWADKQIQSAKGIDNKRL